MNEIQIIKANGDRAVFKIAKLIASLKKAGASDQIALEIGSEIESSLTEGSHTIEIYKKAFAKLKKTSRPNAARYKLKKAILELGETGFPFEKFVGELLRAEGFQITVGVHVKGKCVTHEVDVIAEKENKHYMCECKFHNSQGRNCNVKIPLYIHSRFKDVESQWLLKKGHSAKFHQGWIFTNTRFTSDAIQFAECSGMQLISWDYPKGNGIKDRIDKTGVHPITSLSTLTKKEKKDLIDLNIITCKMLSETPKLLTEMNIPDKRRAKILEEAIAVCAKIKYQ